VAKRRHLSKKQLEVIEDMFGGELDEQAVLDKNKVSRKVFNRWLSDDSFVVEFDRRMEWLNQQSELIIARYKALAAAKLVQLTDSDKEETRRRACMDIISLAKPAARTTGQLTDQSQTADPQENRQLPPEVAGRLLAALAKERR